MVHWIQRRGDGFFLYSLSIRERPLRQQSRETQHSHRNLQKSPSLTSVRGLFWGDSEPSWRLS
jgi:hypothetical protein